MADADNKHPMYEQIQDAYDRFNANLKLEHNRLARKVEDQAWENLRGEVVNLAKMMHEAREDNMPMLELRQAIRKAGDNTGFKRIYNAVEAPDIDLRKTHKKGRTLSRWLEDGTTFVYVDDKGTEHHLENLTYDGMYINWDSAEDNDYYEYKTFSTKVAKILDQMNKEN